MARRLPQGGLIVRAHRRSAMGLWIPLASACAGLVLAITCARAGSGDVHPSMAAYTPLEARSAPVARGGSSLHVTFLGTSTLLLTDGKTAILTDGFFSRPSLIDVAFAPLVSREEEIVYALARARLAKASAVLVAHSHYDHALDAQVVARKLGAVLVGSESTRRIAESGFQPGDTFQSIEQPIKLGDFVVTPVRSPHSRPTRFAGEIEPSFRASSRVWDYKEGGSYAFVIGHPLATILIHPSANADKDQYKNVEADIVFLGIGGLGRQGEDATRALWKEVVTHTRPKAKGGTASRTRLVVPIHWDNFMVSLRHPLRPHYEVPGDFDRTMSLLKALAEEERNPAVELRLMTTMEPVDVLNLAR